MKVGTDGSLTYRYGSSSFSNATSGSPATSKPSPVRNTLIGSVTLVVSGLCSLKTRTCSHKAVSSQTFTPDDAFQQEAVSTLAGNLQVGCDRCEEICG